MNKSLPLIRESPEHLKQLLTRERHPAKHQRLHALYLLASGQARFRTELATLLGLSRNTIGRWLDLYAKGGLDALLDIYVPAGKAPALRAEHIPQLHQALQQPEGFASYDAVRQWIATNLGVSLSYKATHKLVRYKLGAKLKVARPSHIKKR
jgi:transposase